MTNLPQRFSRSGSPIAGPMIENDPVDIASGKARSWPYVLFGLVTLVSLLGGFGAWAYSARLDGAVIADARFAVESRRKTIRHLQGGIVSDIFVSEGDSVRKDQILLTLDSTVDTANLAVIDAELDQLSAQRTRLNAELNGRDELAASTPSENSFGRSANFEIQSGQRALFFARLESRRSEKAIRKKRIGKLREEIAGIEKQIRSNALQIEIIDEELAGLRALEKRKLVPRRRLLSLEREAEQLRGRTAALQVGIVRASNAIDEIGLEAIQAKRRFEEQVTQEMRSIEPRISQLTEQRVAARQKLALVQIKAPTDGFVVGLKANTKGGVIRPGDDIMELVPQGDNLVLEARVQTTDVDKIKFGNEARIQLTAFDQSVTPEGIGTVLSVSADKLEDERTGQEYYLARLRLNPEQSAGVRELEFVPGMPATVFIQTGSRTPLSYFLQPLNDRLKRAFTEG